MKRCAYEHASHLDPRTGSRPERLSRIHAERRKLAPRLCEGLPARGVRGGKAGISGDVGIPTAPTAAAASRTERVGGGTRLATLAGSEGRCASFRNERNGLRGRQRASALHTAAGRCARTCGTAL